MILCDTHCIPCCDFCVYAIHDEWDEERWNDELHIMETHHHVGGPIGCNRWDDQEHQDIAESCGSCDDYHCWNVAEDIDFVCMECGERIIGAAVYEPCPVCGTRKLLSYDEDRAILYREDWINTRKYKCVNCGKWHWDISRREYKCECGSTLFEDKTGESV